MNPPRRCARGRLNLAVSHCAPLSLLYVRMVLILAEGTIGHVQATGATPPDPAALLWPMPVSAMCVPGNLPLGPNFAVQTKSSSTVVAKAAERYTKLFSPHSSLIPQRTAPRTVSAVLLLIANSSEVLDASTRYDYTLSFSGTDTEITAAAASPYAAVAALETIGQLLSGCTAGSGCTDLSCLELAVTDSPTYVHRALLIDAGRRHYPPSLVESLIEGMAMVKLNVLRLHFADYGNSEYEQYGAGGIRIESTRYPQLTANLTDSAGNRLFYTQNEVRELVEYARLRGVRILPELEQTGHASYLWSLAGAPHLLEFCSNNTEDKTGAQVYNDPAGRAKAVLTGLVEEYSSLFPDAIFHIGSDETAYVGKCTKENTIALERAVADKVKSLGKTPMLWWAPATTLDVATPGETIINAWTPDYSAVQATKAGFEAVESAGGQFYLDHPKGNGWADLAPFWWDISRGDALSSNQRELLLGGAQLLLLSFAVVVFAVGRAMTGCWVGPRAGEVSMWNNPFCLWGECHSTKGERPCGWAMSGADLQYDAQYAQAIAGAIWPKAAVAAGSFYRFNASLARSELTQRLDAMTSAMTRRGLQPCACDAFDGHGDGCTPAARCGVAYANQTSPGGAPVQKCN